MGHDWLGGLGTATGADPANAAGADDADPDLADVDPDLDPAAGAGADDAAADADLDPDPDAAAIRRCPSSTRRPAFASSIASASPPSATLRRISSRFSTCSR